MAQEPHDDGGRNRMVPVCTHADVIMRRDTVLIALLVTVVLSACVYYPKPLIVTKATEKRVEVLFTPGAIFERTLSGLLTGKGAPPRFDRQFRGSV